MSRFNKAEGVCRVEDKEDKIHVLRDKASCLEPAPQRRWQRKGRAEARQEPYLRSTTLRLLCYESSRVVDPLPGTSFSEIEQAFFDKLIPGRQQARIPADTEHSKDKLQLHYLCGCSQHAPLLRHS